MKESETIELKKSTAELKEAIISIVAILNKHKRGEIYFGIRNDGRIVGQHVTENTIREISKTISDHIEPKIFPQINKVIIDKKECVHVEFSGEDVPYYAYGRAYVRVGDENKQISVKELENLILKKNKDKLKWDSEVCKKAELKDISLKKLKWFVKETNRHYMSIENSLEKLGLLKDSKLINAAVILFGKNPEKFFRNAKLRCAVFGTTETSIIIDRQEFEGDLFYLIEKAEEYILKNIHIGMRIEGLRRIDAPEIDKEAFREAIINAFCHRDYYEYDSINIAIFKDRLEIRNPGTLYGGLTIEQIKKEMISKRRNEIIADMFHQVHFIEKWGRGIGLILSKEPDTEIKEIANTFIVVFKRKEVKEPTQKTTQKTTQKIIELVKQNPKITREEMSHEIGITPDGVKCHINNLRKAGILKRSGGRKGGHWTIKETQKWH